MKTDTSKKGLYLGATAGLVIFIFIGLLPSSFVGGVLGLKLASYLFGTSGGAELFSRAVVGLAMTTGVLAAGCVIVVGTSLIGWGIAHMTLVSKPRSVHGSV